MPDSLPIKNKIDSSTPSSPQNTWNKYAHKEVWPVREKLRSLLTWPGGKTCHFSKLIQELLSAVVWQLILSRLSTRSPTPTPQIYSKGSDKVAIWKLKQNILPNHNPVL